MNRSDQPTHENDAKRLRAMLIEDTGSVDGADALLDTVQKLRTWRAPDTNAADTQALLAVLRQEMPVQQKGLFTRLDSWWPLLLVRAQLRIVKRAIWAASLLVMLLGLIVTLVTYTPGTPVEALPIVWVSPLAAAIGIAFLYGVDEREAFEIEHATPTSARLVLVVRLAMVFSFDLLIGVTSSLILSLIQSDITLWPLVLTWLIPMAFLSALAFWLSVQYVDPLIGTLVAMVLWMLHSLARFMEFTGSSYLSSVPNLLTVEARPWLLLAAIVLSALAIWLAGNERQQTESYL